MACPRGKLFILILLGIFLYGGKALAANGSVSDVLTDPGLVEGESVGCKYSTIDGLVYFCGFVKNSDTAEPVEGITIAVYEELPPQPTLLDPEGLYSGSGKYGGNLVHLFTSTSTNANGHYEITGRQGENVYVAFMCGSDFLGGMKRIEDLSRIEYLDEFVDCNNAGYVTPPPQLSYVDRKGFLECTANFLEEEHGAATSLVTGYDTQPVGYSTSPTILAQSQISIENYDYRFLPKEIFDNLLSVGGDISEFVSGAIKNGSDYFEPEDEDNIVSPGAQWIDVKKHGAWRERDCLLTYQSGHNHCSIRAQNLALGPDPNENRYLVMNHLKFIPPWPSAPAFARIDIRNSLRQVSQSNSAVARYMDAVFGNYIGDKALIKQPIPEEEIEGTLDDDHALISCDALRDSMSINNLRPSSGPGAMLRSPGELETDAIDAYAWLTDGELASAVCVEDGVKVSVKQACYDEPWKGLCRPEHLLPKGTGSGLYSFTSQDYSDSVDQDNNDNTLILDNDDSDLTDSEKSGAINSNVKPLRTIEFGVFSTEADQGRAWKDQKEVILTGEANVNAARNPISTACIAGSGTCGGKNYLGVLSSPSFGVSLVTVDPDLLDAGEEGAPALDDSKTLQKSEENLIVKDQTTTLVAQAPVSPNAVKKEIEIQDVGSDSVAHCTISTIFDTDNDFPALTRSAIGTSGDLIEDALKFASNLFFGNAEHISDDAVGSGTFYTIDSQERDRLLLNYYDRDVFDSLRAMATAFQRIDFSSLDFGDVVGAVASRISGALGQQPKKTFGQRHNTQTTIVPMTVTYELNEENFNSFFHLPSPPYTPNRWGGHDSYPWGYLGNVPPGERCNTAVDTPDGLSRTCRTARCGTTAAEVSCDGTLCEVTRQQIRDIEDNCNSEQRRACAISQETTKFELTNALQNELFLDTLTTGNKTHTIPYTACVMERAGPYVTAPRLDYNVENKVTQEDNKFGALTPVDAMVSSAENLAKAFSSPGQQFVRQEVAADADIAHSNSPDPFETAVDVPVENAALVTQGYTTVGIGGPGSSAIYTPAAPVTTVGGAGVDNRITYHCNNLGVDVDGEVVGGDWNCPIVPPAFCSGTFGQVQGLDLIPISPAGQTAIRATFSVDAFRQSQEVYAAIEEEFGIPCEVMAGIHYREAGNSPTGSFEDGSPISGTLLESGQAKAERILMTMGVSDGSQINTVQEWARALLKHNGEGNNNCSAPPNLTLYRQCPSKFPGEDNNFIMAYADSNHDRLAIIYPQDHTRADRFCATTCRSSLAQSTYKTACSLCPPPIEETKVGALVLAKYLLDLGLTTSGQ